MAWFNLRSALRAAVAADASDTKIIDGAANNGGSRSDVDVVMPVIRDRPDPPLSEEIKRRQVALIERYIVAVRAR